MLLRKPRQNDLDTVSWINSLFDEQVVEEILRTFPDLFIEEEGCWYVKDNKFSSTGKAYAASYFTNRSGEINVSNGLPYMDKIPDIATHLRKLLEDVPEEDCIGYQYLWWNLNKSQTTFFESTDRALRRFLFVATKRKENHARRINWNSFKVWFTGIFSTRSSN